jgi:uncharacterized membrane protein
VQRMRDQQLEQIVSGLLRTGVLLAGAVVIFGGALFLLRHGHEQVAYGKFAGTPAMYRRPDLIFEGMLRGRGRSVIQLGLLLLIATPVARVILCLVGFAMERDRIYVAISSIVLAVLLTGLFI